MVDIQQIDVEVQELMHRIREQTLTKMDAPFTVDEKTGRKDLVTTVDKSNEQALVSAIRKIDPAARILGEEGFGDQIRDLTGHVWFIDPIDGTMNFVMQKNRFAVMAALYVDGQPTLGYILDVINDDLYHGGPAFGAFVNHQQLPVPANPALADALIGISGPLLIENRYQMQQVARVSRGPRMYGSAGLEFVSVLRGELCGYVSYLKPWDFAAGNVLANVLGIPVKTIDGAPLDMLSSNVVLVATRRASEEVIQLAN